MNTFLRGQKGKLTDLGCNQNQFAVTLDVTIPGGSIDVSCFGLDANDKLSDDRYMIFFNQTASPENAITLDQSSGKAIFRLDLSKIPESISKLVFTAAIDGPGTMRNINPSSFLLGEAVTFLLNSSDFQSEVAMIVGEIYRKDGIWRFGAVGQGFAGGLSSLLSHFGGSQISSPSSPAALVPEVVTAPAPAAPAAPRVSLSKITLEKKGDKISLEKNEDTGYGRIRVNLNWNQSSAGTTVVEKGGFFNRLLGSPKKVNGIDLDLGCLFEMANGQVGGVQALGNSWGSFNASPYMELAGDDRTGTSTDGENIFINGDRFTEIKRALVFAFIYEGAPNWGATDGVVTIEVPKQVPVEVRLDNGNDTQMMCAIAMIENTGGKLQVTKLAEYFSQHGTATAHEMMDRRFGFNLTWRTGSKD